MLKTKITYHRVETDSELNAILKLQSENLPQKISVLEKQQEGYVTVHHTFDILKRMNNSHAHIIAKHDQNVIGYALCMSKRFRDDISVLAPMFNEIDTIIPKTLHYIVMGQVCVSKQYRKQGVFRGLYHYMSEVLKPSFSAIITEVNTQNARSSIAHQAVGFQHLKTYTSNGDDWEIISLTI
jgi:predicted GNAT superfamily acetyltransferase